MEALEISPIRNLTPQWLKDFYQTEPRMWSELIVLVLSLSLLVLGVMLIQTGNQLIKHGKKSNAIVFKNNFKGVGARGVHYPVVRFLTEEKVWITKELTVGYPLALKEGSELTVIYDPENANTVEIDSSFQLEILPRILVVLGIGGMTTIVLELLDVVNFLE